MAVLDCIFFFSTWKISYRKGGHWMEQLRVSRGSSGSGAALPLTESQDFLYRAGDLGHSQEKPKGARAGGS